MAVVDFHTHILSQIDDGSKNIETSIKMLDMCKKQGIDTVIATPHFYAERVGIDEFLKKRQETYENLINEVCAIEESSLKSDGSQCKFPNILLGAEVRFFKGIGKAERLEELTIQGTNTILLEMPFEQWTEELVSEVGYLINNRGFSIIIAHVERYFESQKNNKYINQIIEMVQYTQVNAGSLKKWSRRRKVIKLIKKRQVHLLGSDCHDAYHRLPNVGEGRLILNKKLGSDVLDYIDANGERLLNT